MMGVKSVLRGLLQLLIQMILYGSLDQSVVKFFKCCHDNAPFAGAHDLCKRNARFHVILGIPGTIIRLLKKLFNGQAA